MTADPTAWTAFYVAMADSLVPWQKKGGDLLGRLKIMAAHTPLMGYLHFENETLWKERDFAIDPFTTLAIFNRGVTAAHRHELAASLAKMLGVAQTPPETFHGIPHLDPRNSMYEGNSQLWTLFDAAISRNAGFAQAFDAATAIKGNAVGTLSIGLFWVRPERFMPIDRISAPYIEDKYGIVAPVGKCSGAEYVEFIQELKKKMPAGDSFPLIAFHAWQRMHRN